MGEWTYTILNIVFFTPFILIFWFGIYRKILFKRIKFIVLSGLFGAAYFFVVDLPATRWGAWEFDHTKNLGAFYGKSVSEELVWAVLVCMTVALMIEVVIERTDKK